MYMCSRETRRTWIALTLTLGLLIALNVWVVGEIEIQREDDDVGFCASSDFTFYDNDDSNESG